MSTPICRPRTTDGSASMVALAVALLITTLATGCLRLVIGSMQAASHADVPPTAVTELASVSSRVAVALSDDSTEGPMPMIRTLPGAILRDASSMYGVLPVNPVIADPALVERVYAERTGSDLRARNFASEMAARVATGAQLKESDIRLAAGFDYPHIAGLITGEPILNVNTAPQAELQALPELIAPHDGVARSAIARMINALVDEREHRQISAGELASAIETVAAFAAVAGPEGAADTPTPADRALLIQQLSAFLGVRTWVWELELVRDRWHGTAVIAHLPGHPAAIVLGLAVESRRSRSP